MARFGVKEVANVTFINLLTNKPELYLDTLKMSNLENNAEQSFATGGSGAPRLVGWDFNRTSTFTIQDALLNPKAIAMQTGTELTKQKEEIYKREVTITTDDGSGGVGIDLEEVPVDASITIYKTVDGYGHDEEVTGFTVVGKTVEVTTGLTIGDQVIVYYRYETTSDAEVITVKSDKFAGFYKVIGDTLWRNEQTGEDEAVQIVVPKAKISSQFTLTMQPDGEPSVFDFNLDVYKDPRSTDMVKIIRY